VPERVAHLPREAGFEAGNLDGLDPVDGVGRAGHAGRDWIARRSRGARSTG
jgi:hypothetical protein